MELPRYVSQARRTNDDAPNNNFTAIPFCQIIEKLMEVYNGYLQVLSRTIVASSAGITVTNFFSVQHQITRHPSNMAFVMGIMAIKNERNKVYLADPISISQCKDNILKLISMCQQHFVIFNNSFQINEVLVNVSALLTNLFDQMKLELNGLGSPYIPLFGQALPDEHDANSTAYVPRGREAESAQDEHRSRSRPRTK